MLSEKRIKEAENNTKNYLKEGLLKRIDKINENILNILKRDSEESLKIANMLFKNNLSSLWVIVCSYYSMYYIANAVLYKYGYKVGKKISHKVTSDSLIVYIRGKLKQSIKEEILADYDEAREEAIEIAGLESEEIIKTFDLERIKRERFQYETTEIAKKNKAQTSLERAKKFVFEIEKLII